jgi:hypothetical protein
MDKENVFHIQNWVLSNKKGYNYAICSKMGGNGNPYSEHNKPSSEKFSHVENRPKQTIIWHGCRRGIVWGTGPVAG